MSNNTINSYLGNKLILLGCNLIFLLLFVNSVFSQDEVVGVSYKLSVKPNYHLGAGKNDITSLTDGVFSKKEPIWTQKTTVGWRGVDRLDIDFDLKKTKSVSSVSFNTARGSFASVYFPAHIFVFMSNDNKKFAYVGDMIEGADNAPGDYLVSKFSLENIDKNARFIKLVVVAEGKFIFSDEITIKAKSKGRAIASSTLRYARTITDSDINLLRENSNYKRSSILGERVRNSNIRFSKENGGVYTLNKIDSWGDISLPYTPTSRNDELNYQLTSLKNGSQYFSFVITNLENKSKEFFFSRHSVNGFDLKLFEVPFVNANYVNIADPLRPITSSIHIPPFESKVFMAYFDAEIAGNYNPEIRVFSGKDTSTIKVKYEILSNELTTNRLNAVNWAYLNSPLLSGSKDEAVVDLKKHHINTAVIPQNITPKIDETDLSSYTEYVKYFRGYKYIFLFSNFKYEFLRAPNGIDFMSEQWKLNYLKWYKSVIDATIDAGIDPNNIYIYPYDEPTGTDVDDFRKFILWANKAIKGFKSYSTINDTQALEKLGPYLDISQIVMRDDLYNKSAAVKGSLWLYDIKSSSRTLSPYSYYRLMSWKAFLLNASGIGFWNYAQNGSNRNLINAPFANSSQDYSVIYTDIKSSNLFSSRRWEAFKLGIEDFNIIAQYEKKYGIKKARDIVRKVVGNPENTTLADEAINKMLRQL